MSDDETAVINEIPVNLLTYVRHCTNPSPASQCRVAVILQLAAGCIMPNHASQTMLSSPVAWARPEPAFVAAF